ncbi:hypothetical protein ECTPHS_14255, partial [Ectothiorhodospira sp. PHS-1]
MLDMKHTPPHADMPCLLRQAGRRHAGALAIITPEDSLSFRRTGDDGWIIGPRPFWPGA